MAQAILAHSLVSILAPACGYAPPWCWSLAPPMVSWPSRPPCRRSTLVGIWVTTAPLPVAGGGGGPRPLAGARTAEAGRLNGRELQVQMTLRCLRPGVLDVDLCGDLSVVGKVLMQFTEFGLGGDACCGGRSLVQLGASGVVFYGFYVLVIAGRCTAGSSEGGVGRANSWSPARSSWRGCPWCCSSEPRRPPASAAARANALTAGHCAGQSIRAWAIADLASP